MNNSISSSKDSNEDNSEESEISESEEEESDEERISSAGDGEQEYTRALIKIDCSISNTSKDSQLSNNKLIANNAKKAKNKSNKTKKESIEPKKHLTKNLKKNMLKRKKESTELVLSGSTFELTDEYDEWFTKKMKKKYKELKKIIEIINHSNGSVLEEALIKFDRMKEEVRLAGLYHHHDVSKSVINNIPKSNITYCQTSVYTKEIEKLFANYHKNNTMSNKKTVPISSGKSSTESFNNSRSSSEVTHRSKSLQRVDNQNYIDSFKTLKAYLKELKSNEKISHFKEKDVHPDVYRCALINDKAGTILRKIMDEVIKELLYKAAKEELNIMHLREKEREKTILWIKERQEIDKKQAIREQKIQKKIEAEKMRKEKEFREFKEQFKIDRSKISSTLKKTHNKNLNNYKCMLSNKNSANDLRIQCDNKYNNINCQYTSNLSERKILENDKIFPSPNLLKQTEKEFEYDQVNDDYDISLNNINKFYNGNKKKSIDSDYEVNHSMENKRSSNVDDEKIEKCNEEKNNFNNHHIRNNLEQYNYKSSYSDSHIYSSENAIKTQLLDKFDEASPYYKAERSDKNNDPSIYLKLTSSEGIDTMPSLKNNNKHNAVIIGDKGHDEYITQSDSPKQMLINKNSNADRLNDSININDLEEMLKDSTKRTQEPKRVIIHGNKDNKISRSDLSDSDRKVKNRDITQLNCEALKGDEFENFAVSEKIEEKHKENGRPKTSRFR